MLDRTSPGRLRDDSEAEWLDTAGVIESALLEALDIAIAAQRWARVAELAAALKARHEGSPAAVAWARVAALARAFGGAGGAMLESPAGLVHRGGRQ